MVIHVAEKQAGLCFVHNQPEVATHPNRLEMRILHLVEFVEFQARIGGIHLQVEGRCRDRFLFIAGEVGQAFYECIGNAEFHINILFPPGRRFDWQWNYINRHQPLVHG